MTNDRNILDIITAVNTDLRHTENFRALLRSLEETEACRVAKLDIEFLYRTLDMKLAEKREANNNRGWV